MNVRRVPVLRMLIAKITLGLTVALVWKVSKKSMAFVNVSLE